MNTNKLHPLSFTDENVAKLFGAEAAEDEDFGRLQSYYLKNKTHEKVTSNLPLRILVAHKGIGKSAIFTMARHEDIRGKRLSMLIKPDDVTDLSREQADFSQMIRSWKQGLLSIIVKKVCDNLGLIAKDEQYQEMINGTGKVLGFFRTLFQKSINDSVNLDEASKILIGKFLVDNRIIVYIDDMDRGWESKKEDIRRISALLNAIRDLSNENKGLQFRLSLRSDVYYLVRTSDESTDKIESSVIWHSWTNHEILILLIKRIESFFGRDVDVDRLRQTEQIHLSYYLDSVFEKRFTGYGKWEHAPMYRILMSLTRKRPRDLVKLCTLAAKDAYDKDSCLIRTENLKNVFVEYSQGRIQDTVNEYRSELPDIERLLLNMKPSTKEIKAGKGFIYTTSELKKKINDIKEHGRFLLANQKEADAQQLMQFMYKINFITARKTMPDGFIDRKYFEENKYLTSGLTDFGYDWEIHPAFRWALSQDTRDIFKQIDLSRDDI